MDPSPSAGEGSMTRKKVSYSYLSELREDYAEKARSPRWEWLHSWLEDEIRKLDYQIRNIKEQELCAHFQQERILASILAKTN